MDKVNNSHSVRLLISPSDATDADYVRNLLSLLSDIDKGGFSAYVEQFTNRQYAHNQANQESVTKECVDWARRRIRNTIGKLHLVSSAFWRDENTPSFQDIIKSQREFLRNEYGTRFRSLQDSQVLRFA